MAATGAIGTAPIAASPLAGSAQGTGYVGTATGTSSVSGVGYTYFSAVTFTASGTSTVSGVGLALYTKGAGSASGLATVSGVLAVNSAAIAVATSSAIVSGVAVGPTGQATGSSTAYGVSIFIPSFGASIGSAFTYGFSPSVVGTANGAAFVSGLAPTIYLTGIGSAFGTSIVLAYSLAGQTTIGSATGSATASFWSPSNAVFSATGTTAAVAIGTYSYNGFTPPLPFVYSFSQGPTGTYIEPDFTGNVCSCANCLPPTPTPTPSSSFTWKASSISNVQVCDITWAGNTIIVGRAGVLWSGDSCVYLSTSTGRTWSKLPVTPDNWVSVTMSAEGRLCAAYPLDTQVTYVSNNYAAGWQSYPRPWGVSQTNAAEISDDGTTTIVTANPGNLIYLSSDNGVSWTSKNTGLLPNSQFYTASCLSSNASTMFAGKSLDRMHRSINYGALWSACNKSFSSQFTKVACSGDGNNVIATSSSTTGYYQVSHDAGLTWTKGGVNLSDNTDGWNCCAVSTNGRVMAVGKYGGRLDVSFDYGVTWVTQNVDGHNGTYLWTDIGINYDGTVIVACAINGPLYIGTAA